jgi:acetyl esterase
MDRMKGIDADAAKVLELVRQSGRPPYETLQPGEARELYRAARLVLQPEPPEVAEVRDIAVSAPSGAIPLRLYRPAGSAAETKLPALIFFHGGGWVLGDLDTHDGVCRRLANAAGCAVVAVDYRLGPEHKFPAAVEDALHATEWIAGKADALGLDGSRLAVGGDSAGGNLAAIVCIDARDRGGPTLRHQLLIYPATDMACSHESHRIHTEGLPLTHATVVWFRDHYLRSADDHADWRASPLRAVEFRDLPPAYVITAGFDPLASEGEEFAAKLRAAGVPVTLRRYDSQIHGFVTMGRIIAAAGEALDAAGAAVRQHLE